MLLQGQIQSSVAPASASATAPPVPASAAELAVPGFNTVVAVIRYFDVRKCVEEELRLAEDALDLQDGPSTIAANLEVFEEKAEESSRKGVQLLVTPEYGLTGFPGAVRSQWWDYAVDIPDLPTGDVRPVPCLETTKFPAIVKRLSCIARSYRLVFVVGLIDLKRCSLEPYPGCEHSRDGSLLFNTALAFDADGAYVAKYHKANLWGEHAADAGSSCVLPEFFSKELNMSFGVFVCADLINAWPALELVDKGIQHFVMPLSWSNEMFQMQPLPWIQAWSKLMNVTIAAANSRSPTSSGSGIFSSGVPLAVAYDLSGREADQLAVASAPGWLPGTGLKAFCPTDLSRTAALKPHGSQWLTYQLDMSVGSHHASVCSNYQPGFADGPTCCNVTYTSKATGKGYVLVLLNGLDFAPGIEPWAGEACAVLPCSEGADDCLSYPAEALSRHKPSWFGEFSAVELQVTFSVPQLVFPQVLSGDGLLSPLEWHLQAAAESYRHSLRLSSRAAEELLSLQLYGRPFTKDPDASQKCPCALGSLDS
ncbi:VNN1 [Symbiodinium microadriaticum]|nr:VNN1 [Symbiodinium microadriaticum]